MADARVQDKASVDGRHCWNWRTCSLLCKCTLMLRFVFSTTHISFRGSFYICSSRVKNMTKPLSLEDIVGTGAPAQCSPTALQVYVDAKVFLFNIRNILKRPFLCMFFWGQERPNPNASID